MNVRAEGISLHPDRLSGLLSAIPSLLKEAPRRWQVEQVVLWFWVGRRFRNGGFLEAASALTERCSRPRYRAAAELER